MPERIGDALHERRLGPDDDEVDVEGVRQPQETLCVLGPDRVALAERRDTRAPGRSVQIDGSGPRQTPRERMLAPTRPDQENPHRPSLVTPLHGLAYDPLVDDASFQRWLDDYDAAWETYDASAIAALFAENAVYRYHPWDDAGDELTGRDSIVASWLGDRDEPGSWTARYRPWLVVGARAVAVGVSRYLGPERATVEREYHNVFLCRFDGDGLCTEFTEHFMRRTE